MGIWVDLIQEKYQYYENPDGTDPVNKLLGLSKYGLLTGSIFGLFDCHLYSKVTTFSSTLNTMGYWIVPMTGMCFAAASTIYISTRLRGKDDCKNYILGAFAAGGVLHAWQKCVFITSWGILLFTLYGVLKKDSKINGTENPLLPDEYKMAWVWPWRNMENRDWRPRFFPRPEKDYYSW